MVRIVGAMLLITLVPQGAAAAVITFSGFFNDTGNTALVWSDLGPARFSDDVDIANNVALYSLTVPVGGMVSFDSVGYAAGGAEPYLTVFAGSGAGATFVDSSFFDPAIDFSVSRVLAAGTYTIAMSVYLNMSFAENNPDADPTLGDAFIALGVPNGLGDSYYELRITVPDAVPEPVAWTLLALGLGAVARRRR